MSGPPEFVSLRDRLTNPSPKLAYRIEGLQLRSHRVLLAAQHKVGKTTLVTNVARCLVDGEPLLERYAVAPVTGAVLVLDTEMASSQSDDWYRSQQIEHDDCIVVMAMKGRMSSFDITNPKVRSAWASAMKAYQVTYVILDCLRPVLDALGLNEHTQAGTFLTALDELLAEASVPEALVVHHIGHDGKHARGDSRILDWPDGVWTLEGGQGPKAVRRLSAVGRDITLPKTELRFDPKTRRLSVKTDADQALAAVCALLLSEGPLSQNKIEQQLADIVPPRQNIRNAIAKGVSTGVLTSTPGPKIAAVIDLALQVASSP
jgi:hypothetical protein